LAKRRGNLARYSRINILTLSQNLRVFFNTHVLRFAWTERKERINMVEAISRENVFKCVPRRSFSLPAASKTHAYFWRQRATSIQQAWAMITTSLAVLSSSSEGTYASLAPVNRLACFQCQFLPKLCFIITWCLVSQRAVEQLVCSKARCMGGSHSGLGTGC
jgi:hypothetical protein